MQENSPETMPKIETKNKTFVVVSAILLLSIAVIIAVFFNKNQVNKDVNQEINQEINQETAIQEENEDISDAQPNEQDNNLLFSDLIANRQGSYLCQIEDEEGSYIYYFDNERIAIEIKVEDSHMKTIVDDEFTYNWDVEEKVGTKFANQDDFMEKDLNQESDVFDEAEMENLTEEDLLPAEDVGPFDPAKFVCQAWTVDESVFTPPTDVIFQDLSQIQEQMEDFVQ